MDVFAFREELVAEYERFSRSFTDIRAEDVSCEVDAAYAGGWFWPDPLIQLNPNVEPRVVAITGGKEVRDPGAVFARLDKTKAKYDDIVLVHGGGRGVERVAAQWAERNGVHQVVCKPDWDRHGRAAPFRRNDELLNLLPKGLIAFPGSGITDNLVDKAVKLGIPVARCTA